MTGSGSRISCKLFVPALGLAALALPSALVAQEAPADAVDDAADDAADEQIIVYGRALEQVGIARSGSQGTVGYADFENVPISRTGELVENVPGVIATQHSGSGKANQYFLRGFNLDHGTDFAGFVDGVPINMRTHGHGQGYLDFNFLIPETLERIDYRKGPYFADVGDFSAAGTVSFVTRDRLDPFAKVEVGAFGHRRLVAGGSVDAGAGMLTAAVEGQAYDGPWVLDENLERVAGLVKYVQGSREDGFSVQLNGYDSSWTSTDQVPLRAVESGLIDRFGFIDPDLGGETTRLGAVFNAGFGNTRLNAFITSYDFRLVSNFTYFLDDPVEGDEFVQEDERVTLGGAASHALSLGPATLTLGGDIRHDAIERVGLFESAGAVITDPVRVDEVDETGLGLYADVGARVLPGLRAFVGARFDYLDWDVRSDLPVNSGSGNDGFFAPKAGLAFEASEGLEFYANYGHSFHSNDVRGATIVIDPANGDAVDPVPAFARAEGAEIGARVERGGLNASLVGFWLDLESELVFVGDAGNTEPNDGSRRYGVEATLFWQPARWLTMDASYTYTDARFEGPADGEDFIPGAVPGVFGGGVTASPLPGFDLTAQLRHFSSAPLIEDNSVRSDATTLVNAAAYYRFGALTLGAELFNVFDAEEADITYFYESRLAGEAVPVEDIHFHPVEPRQLRLSLRYDF